jgi:hypothetical protein
MGLTNWWPDMESPRKGFLWGCWYGVSWWFRSPKRFAFYLVASALTAFVIVQVSR